MTASKTSVMLVFGFGSTLSAQNIAFVVYALVSFACESIVLQDAHGCQYRPVQRTMRMRTYGWGLPGLFVLLANGRPWPDSPLMISTTWG